MPFAKHGILSVEPNAPMLPQQPDSVKRALGLSQGLYDMFGTHYSNKLKEAEARKADLASQLAAGTLQSDIAAKNTKNNTDIQYYPQLQAMELAKQGASIKEIQARTGLSYAEAGAARARASASYAEANKTRLNTSPIAKQQALYDQYTKSAPGSREQMYYGGLLKEEMGRYGSPVPGAQGGFGSSVPNTPTGGSPPPSAGGGLQTNPLGGGNRSTFHQAYNPETGETIESPTIATGSQNQQRIAATAEIGSIEPILKKGFDPYLGAGGTAKLAYDGMLARSSPNSKAGKSAAERLKNYNLANKLKREAANIISRQSAGQSPGVEAAREQELASFGNLPLSIGNYFTPNLVLQKAQDEYFPAQEKLAQAAVNQERQGFKVKGEQPQWATQQNEQRDPFFDSPEQQKVQAVAGGFDGNPNARAPQQQNNHPQEFQSKAQAQAYYNSLSPQEKQRYLASLPE